MRQVLAVAAFLCVVPACNSVDTAQSQQPNSQSNADAAAKALIDELGRQQAFARLGWQQNADYKPSADCFDHWTNENAEALSSSDVRNCETHASDLSRLYASYGTNAPPIIFKSQIFWAEVDAFNINIFPRLVDEWQSAGGSEDDKSFLEHPVCAEPLQAEWDGSEFFYDGAEHPLCRFYKMEMMEGDVE